MNHNRDAAIFLVNYTSLKRCHPIVFIFCLLLCMGMYPFCKDVKGIIYTDMYIKFLRLDLT